MDEVAVGLIALLFGLAVLYLSFYRSFHLFRMGLIIMFIGIGILTKHYNWPAAIYEGAHAFSLGLLLMVVAHPFFNFAPDVFSESGRKSEKEKK